jgi:SP family galactose:H+ symporter-like MFS transporter
VFLCSDIIPSTRVIAGSCSGLATFANWTSNMLITFIFPLLIAATGDNITFWIYAGMGVLALIFSYRLVPETKGRTLEQIEAQWRESTVA